MKKSSFLWLGYVDLMTSLFFVMLVMFVIAFAKYINVHKEVAQTITGLEQENNQFQQDLIQVKDSLQVTREKFD